MAEPPAEQAILRHIEAVIEEEHRLCRQQQELTVTDPDRLDSLARGNPCVSNCLHYFSPKQCGAGHRRRS